MSEVGIELLAQGKVLGVVVQGKVDARVVGGDVLVGQAGHQLLADRRQRPHRNAQHNLVEVLATSQRGGRPRCQKSG